MSIFSKWSDFKEKRLQKRIASNTKTLLNSKAIKEDRVGAIDFFCYLDDNQIAVPNLLKRFEYSLEHGINDTREKETCLENLLGRGSEIIPLLNEHIKTTPRIAWPIKALNKLGSEEQVVSALKSCLDFTDVAFDQAKVDKNYDILCYLVDYKLDGYTTKLKHFLSYHDERVRFAVLELLAEQDDEEVPALLEPYLVDYSPENTRIHQTAVDAFVRRQWKIQNPAAIITNRLPHNVKLASDMLVKA